jgi:hypothetical protein
VGSEEGGVVRHHFRERKGHRGSSSARGRWWRRPIGLPEEEDSQAADRAGPPVSEEEAVGEGERWDATWPEG